MARSMLGLVIAAINTLLFSCLFIHATYYLTILTIDINENDYAEYESIYGDPRFIYIVIPLTITLILDGSMLIASIFLLLGVQRARHQYMAPWIYLTVVEVVVSVTSIFMYGVEPIQLVWLALQVGSWYPIFRLYRQMRKPQNPQLPENSPLNNGNTEYPQNWRGASAPPMQPAVSNLQSPPLYPSVETANYNLVPNAS